MRSRHGGVVAVVVTAGAQGVKLGWSSSRSSHIGLLLVVVTTVGDGPDADDGGGPILVRVGCLRRLGG